MALFEMFYRSDKFSFKSLHFKNPIRPTLTNVLQIRKVWLFVTFLMFYRSEWLGFAPSQNVLQIRTPRFSLFKMFYRSGDTLKLSVLGIFMCINAKNFLYNFNQTTLQGGENRRKKKRRMPWLYYKCKKSSENPKSNRYDFGAEKIARQWRLSSCLSQGGGFKSKF